MPLLPIILVTDCKKYFTNIAIIMLLFKPEIPHILRMKAGIYIFKHKLEKLAYVGLSRNAKKRADGHFLQIAGQRKPKLKANGQPTSSKQALLDAVPERTLEAAHATFEYEVVETMAACDTLLNAAEKRWADKLIADGYTLYNTAPAGQSAIRCNCCRPD